MQLSVALGFRNRFARVIRSIFRAACRRDTCLVSSRFEETNWYNHYVVVGSSLMGSMNSPEARIAQFHATRSQPRVLSSTQIPGITGQSTDQMDIQEVRQLRASDACEHSTVATIRRDNSGTTCTGAISLGSPPRSQAVGLRLTTSRY